MLRTFLKALLFLFLITSLGLVKQYFTISHIHEHYPTNLFNINIQPQCYFIGNSRIRNSINEVELNKNNKKYTFHNTAINAIGLNFSNVLAQKLSNSNKNSIIFIELSETHTYTHYTGLQLFSQKDYLQALKLYYKHADITTLASIKTLFLESMYGYFNIISFHLLGKPLNLSKSEPSFSPYDQLYTGDDYLFLNHQDFKNHTITPKSEQYVKLIKETIEFCKINNNKLVILLPITYSTVESKEFITSIFDQIPETNKVIYSKDFISKISNKKYLADNIHLNIAGSKLATDNILSIINKQY